jgi:hypothetical protein
VAINCFGLSDGADVASAMLLKTQVAQDPLLKTHMAQNP